MRAAEGLSRNRLAACKDRHIASAGICAAAHAALAAVPNHQTWPPRQRAAGCLKWKTPPGMAGHSVRYHTQDTWLIPQLGPAYNCQFARNPARDRPRRTGGRAKRPRSQPAVPSLACERDGAGRGREIEYLAGERRGRPSRDNVENIPQFPEGTKTRQVAAERAWRLMRGEP